MRNAAVMLILYTIATGAAGQSPTAGLPDHGSTLLLDAIKYSKTGVRLLGKGRIVGGIQTSIQDNPWQAAILVADEKQPIRGFFCGGSVYSKRWIVTAAHCVDKGTLPNQINVLVGTEDLHSGGQRLTVDRIIVHPNWNSETNDYDVAVIRVTADISSTPVGLISSESEQAALVAKALVTVTGWGRTREDGQISAKLMKADVPIVPRDVCNSSVVYGGLISDRMICAGALEGGKDSCQGDSGGPLTTQAGGKRILVGIVSWGEGCARVNRPGIYSRVATLSEWIRGNAQ